MTTEQHPPCPTPVGIGLIRRGDCFLIRRRLEGQAMAGYWEFPGGKVEPDEGPEQATKRECLEETGLAVTIERLRSIVTHRYPHAWVELYYYDCVLLDTDEPLSGFVWVEASVLPSLTFPEANGPILADLARESG
jgi:8-oxo-dGTP diphosphatase